MVNFSIIDHKSSQPLCYICIFLILLGKNTNQLSLKKYNCYYNYYLEVSHPLIFEEFLEITNKPCVSEQFRFIPKLNTRYREFPYKSCISTHKTPLTINIMWYVVTIDAATLTHQYYPKSIVCITVHSWCCIFYGFGQRCDYKHPL